VGVVERPADVSKLVRLRAENSKNPVGVPLNSRPSVAEMIETVLLLLRR